MKWTGLILLLILSFQLMAQRPLNKKDQKAKEEFEALIAAEEKYNELTAKADQAFKAEDYLLARMTYQEAIPFNEEMEQWLVSKVNDLDILMAKNAARSVDSIYVKAPTKAAQLTEVKPNFQIESRPVETPAALVVSAVPEPDTTRLTVADVNEQPEPKEEKPLLKKEVLKVEKQVPKSVIEVKEEKIKEDFSKLDNGITEETFNLPNHEVLRIVVKEGIDVKVFKRVKHNWGGEFYFLDGMDVTKRYWSEQIDFYRVKYSNKEE